MRKVKFFASLTALMTLSVAALTACTTAEASTHHTVSQTGGESVHSSRLDAILERGYIEVATEPSFAPNEFIDTTKTGQDRYAGSDIQLANYIATLVGNGQHYEAHLLKNVKSYDNSSVIYAYDKAPLNSVEMSDSTLQAVKEGMHNLTTGSLSYYFSNCVVSAGAKTGTAETGIANTNNGVFVCFAPYDDPQIAVAVVIEKGGSGAALASTAVDIVNSYFSQEEIGAVVIGENTLLK